MFYRGIDINRALEKQWAPSPFGRKLLCGTLLDHIVEWCQPYSLDLESMGCSMGHNDSSFTKHFCYLLHWKETWIASAEATRLFVDTQQALWGSRVGQARRWTKERGSSLNQCPGTLKYIFLHPSDLFRFVTYVEFVASWRPKSTLKDYLVILFLKLNGKEGRK